MPIVDGKLVMKAPDGRLYRVAPEEAEKAQRDLGWTDAGEDETAKRVAERSRYSKYGSTGQQALAATEQAVRTATLGLAPGTGTPEDIAGREAVLREESPVISAVAQGAGAIAPALVGGGALSLGARALGAGARGAAVAGALGEGAVGGLAEEIEQARFETRDVSAGNIMLFGLGGEIVGRALPKAIKMGVGRIRKARTPLDEITGEGVASAVDAVEQQSLKGQARRAVDMPDGPERAEALKRTAPQLYEQMATEGADDLDWIVAKASEMGDTSSSKRVTERLRETLPEDSPAQMEWFTAQRAQMRAAQERLRAPIDARPPPTAEEFLRTIPDREAREEAAEGIRESIAERLRDYGVKDADAAEGGEKWLVVEREIMAERAPRGEAQGLASGDRTGFGKRFDAIVDGATKRLDKTTETAESYLIIRDTKKRLQHLSKKMSLSKAPGDEILHEEMREIIDGTWGGMRDGLKDRSLFGAAAEIEEDINRSWHDKVIRGLGVAESDLFRRVDVDFKTGRLVHESDPGKVRGYLRQDRVDRAITERKLADVLDGAEDMAAAHERHGTWDPDDVKQLRERVARFRASRSLADEIQAAKFADAPAGAGAREGLDVTGEVVDFATERAADAVVPGGGTILRFAKRILGIDKAGRQATRKVARKLAGVGAETTEQAAPVAGPKAAPPARDMFAGPSPAAPVATTALGRFTGEFSGPQESFEAKKQILADAQVSPEALYDVLAVALDDLPKVSPQLFQGLAARISEKVRFVRENLPSGIANTLLYPNGTPPSMSALREFAVLWNTVMDPESVLDDIEAGTATKAQMQTLKKSDPDLYEQLRGDIIEEIGTNFAAVPISTKLQLDMLLDADGLAGPMFSQDAARMVGDAVRAQKQKPPSKNTGQSASELGSSSGPRGIAAIQSSVTNRGAA